MLRRQASRRLLSAFHLPEVCRQIYAETATLAYPGTIFNLISWDLNGGGIIPEWSAGLTNAHNNAITDIVANEPIFCFYYVKSFGNMCPYGLCKVFPGLQRLHVNTDWASSQQYGNDYENEGLVSWKQAKQEEVDQLEGGVVRLVWHDEPIERRAQ